MQQRRRDGRDAVIGGELRLAIRQRIARGIHALMDDADLAGGRRHLNRDHFALQAHQIAHMLAVTGRLAQERSGDVVDAALRLQQAGLPVVPHIGVQLVGPNGFGLQQIGEGERLPKVAVLIASARAWRLVAGAR